MCIDISHYRYYRPTLQSTTYMYTIRKLHEPYHYNQANTSVTWLLQYRSPLLAGPPRGLGGAQGKYEKWGPTKWIM